MVWMQAKCSGSRPMVSALTRGSSFSSTDKPRESLEFMKARFCDRLYLIWILLYVPRCSDHFLHEVPEAWRNSTTVPALPVISENRSSPLASPPNRDATKSLLLTANTQ